MSTQKHTLNFKKAIRVTPTQVYNAFTNATVLRNWLCDVATVDPKPGGRIYLAWDRGYYACGSYVELEVDKGVTFTWHGRNEPRPTRVQVQIKAKSGLTEVRLKHTGIGSGEKWARVSAEFQKGWKDSLENLVSVLESGEDLRFTRRPMLGIGLNDFNAEIARGLGVPVSRGIRVDNVIEGMGAKAAGLQKDDVIVEFDGQEVVDFPSLHAAVQPHRAGDEVEVVFYRGKEKQRVKMLLSQRPLPEIPTTPQALAAIVHKRNTGIFAELKELLSGVSEAEAEYKPAPGEWSAKETLAHLIHGERGYQNWVSEVVDEHEAQYDDYAGNLPARVEATVEAYPSLGELIEEYRRSLTESEALLARLPSTLSEKKGTYWRLCHNSLEDPFHFYTHLEQMRSALEAARG